MLKKLRLRYRIIPGYTIPLLLNAKQQGAALGQVVTAINNINAGAKETSAGITQTKMGVQRLNEAAQNLKAII